MSRSAHAGRKTKKQQVEEDVEIFNIDDGWSVEALGSADLVGACLWRCSGSLHSNFA